MGGCASCQVATFSMIATICLGVLASDEADIDIATNRFGPVFVWPPSDAGASARTCETIATNTNHDFMSFCL
jgi:hypothetical protein